MTYIYVNKNTGQVMVIGYALGPSKNWRLHRVYKTPAKPFTAICHN